MRHNWWRRMWTLQEFVLAERPIVVVGANKILWDDLVEAVNNTFFSDDARDEMVRRKRQNIKANELVINNIMPPDEAEGIRGIETSIHLVPMWKDIMDCDKRRTQGINCMDCTTFCRPAITVCQRSTTRRQSRRYTKMLLLVS